MVDFVTQSRHYGYKYNAPETRQPISTQRDNYRKNSSNLFKTPRVQGMYHYIGGGGGIYKETHVSYDIE